jgi:hypothetical protein
MPGSQESGYTATHKAGTSNASLFRAFPSAFPRLKTRMWNRILLFLSLAGLFNESGRCN